MLQIFSSVTKGVTDITPEENEENLKQVIAVLESIAQQIIWKE